MGARLASARWWGGSYARRGPYRFARSQIEMIGFDHAAISELLESYNVVARRLMDGDGPNVTMQMIGVADSVQLLAQTRRGILIEDEAARERNKKHHWGVDKPNETL